MFGLIVGTFGIVYALPPAEGALLDGLMGGVEESLRKRAEENGERLYWLVYPWSWGPVRPTPMKWGMSRLVDPSMEGFLS